MWQLCLQYLPRSPIKASKIPATDAGGSSLIKMNVLNMACRHSTTAITAALSVTSPATPMIPRESIPATTCLCVDCSTWPLRPWVRNKKIEAEHASISIWLNSNFQWSLLLGVALISTTSCDYFPIGPLLFCFCVPIGYTFHRYCWIFAAQTVSSLLSIFRLCRLDSGRDFNTSN